MRTGFCWGKPEGKRQLGRPRRTWMNNIKVLVQEMAEGAGFDNLDDDRDRLWVFVNTVMNCRFANNAGNF